MIEITEEDYFKLDAKTNRKLTTLAHITELGDNVSTSTTGESGTTQYLRNNSFLELREDIYTILDKAFVYVANMKIAQFDCEYRGNYSLEPGDKLAIYTDNDVLISYLLNNSISYDGVYSEKISWNYEESNDNTSSNPTSIGEALKLTAARVDKQKQEITLSVTTLNEKTDTINEELAKVQEQVSLKLDSDAVTIKIAESLENGVEKVETSTGFTFNEDGLKVSKSNSEMSTQITEDGMQVFKDNNEVLTANNQGVKALNLHATTYLIIGDNSRFENYGTDRTGCFWIGG